MPQARTSGAYLKLERKVGDFATAGAAAFLVLKGDVIERAGVGLTNLGPTPIKAADAEKHLAGKKPDEATFAEAGRLAAAATPAPSDSPISRSGAPWWRCASAMVCSASELSLISRTCGSSSRAAAS
jgi:carbon-monoxide dehydrogenase medium subunit